MGYTKYSYNRRFFEKVDTEDKAYWAGFIAADGNVASRMNNSRIELNIRDYHHLEKFRDALEGNMPIRESIRPNNHSCYIDVNSKDYCQDLVELGITPQKSLTLDVNFSKISDELIHHFIRGYFDGDGSLNYYTRPPYYYDEWELSFISTKKMLRFFQEQFGISHNLYSCGKNFRFCYKGQNDIQHCLDYMYNDATIYLDRKYEKYLDFINPQRLPKDN